MDKISTIGLFRDSSTNIKNTLDSLDDLKKICLPSFYFYENDSVDDTKNIIKQWISDHDGDLLSENLGAPKYGSVIDINRFVFLSYYRNKARDLIKNTESEFTILFDTDILFDNNHINLLLTAIKSLDCAMVVSNTRQDIPDLMLDETPDSFYDVLPIRDLYNNSGLYFTDCPLVLDADREKWQAKVPVKINAGFSGLAIIKTEILKKCKWSTSGLVEHINFCSEVLEYNDIYIIPESKPRVILDIKTLPIHRFKESAIQQKQIYQNINMIYNTSISKHINIQ